MKRKKANELYPDVVGNDVKHIFDGKVKLSAQQQNLEYVRLKENFSIISLYSILDSIPGCCC